MMFLRLMKLPDQPVYYSVLFGKKFLSFQNMLPPFSGTVGAF